VSHLRQSFSRRWKEWIIKPNDNIENHQDNIQNPAASPNNGSDPVSSSIYHPSGGADKNHYTATTVSSIDLFR
jgi:hypothetical protein